MLTFTAEDARQNMRAILDNALAGKQAVIERYGKPVAAVVGVEEWRELQAWRALQGERVDSSEVDRVMASLGVDVPPVTADVAS